MMALARDVIHRKLARITSNLRLLAPVADLSFDDYTAQPYMRKATERLLQEVVEAAVDLNAHLVVQSGRAAPETLFDSFADAAAAGILPSALATALAPAAGLRNRLVHEYDQLDDRIIHAAVPQALSQFSDYVDAVRAWVDAR